MKKMFNLTSSFKALPGEEGELKIRGLASTDMVDRAGDVVEVNAWTKGGLKNFTNNPIILFNHDYDRPIGRATKLEAVKGGLEMEAVISKSAPGGVYDLIKDGVLGAFSVGFLIKDADSLEGTGGIKVKDAELLEVSVVSVPCNQAATFSVSKAFDSENEYKEFLNSFNNSANLTGQSLAKGEEDSSNVVSDAPEGGSAAKTETKMSDYNIDEIAQKAAEKAAAVVAMKMAEKEAAKEKAAEEKATQEAEQKAAQAAAEEVVVKSVASGTEKLVADFEAKLNERDANFTETLKTFEEALKEKEVEMAQLRDSKRIFSGNAVNVKQAIQQSAQELTYAHIHNILCSKNWENNKFSQDVLEKAGIDYATNAGDIDQEVSSFIEKEVMNELKVARLFREVPVNGQATVVPIQMDVNPAVWAKATVEQTPGDPTTAGDLENRGASDNTYKPSQKILNAYRLTSTTFMDDEVDEQVLVNLMPMLVESIARSHARAVESAILIGGGSITGLDGEASAFATTLSIGGADTLTAAVLNQARGDMGKYGMSPSNLVFVVSQQGYYDLLQDPEFQTLDEVGNEFAVRVTGTLGAVYGVPVVPSEEFDSITSGNAAAFVVYRPNYIIPRLRGIRVEQDREVIWQRRVIVGSQNLGFEELVPETGVNKPSLKIDYAA